MYRMSYLWSHPGRITSAGTCKMLLYIVCHGADYARAHYKIPILLTSGSISDLTRRPVENRCRSRRRPRSGRRRVSGAIRTLAAGAERRDPLSVGSLFFKSSGSPEAFKLRTLLYSMPNGHSVVLNKQPRNAVKYCKRLIYRTRRCSS